MANPLSTNLSSYWKLDGNSTDSVGSLNGTDTDITYSVANGKIVQGAGFNGSSSQIVNATTFTLPANVTMNCWVKTTNTAGFQSIFTFRSGTAFMGLKTRQTTGLAQLDALDNGAVGDSMISGSSVCDGNWHMLTGVKIGSGSGATIQLYVDAVSQGTPITINFTGNFNSVSLEMGEDSGGNFLNGASDEYGYWDRALTSTEIKQLYNFGNGNQYPFITQGGLLNFF